MTYCAARSAGSLRSCSPDPWETLRHGIRPKVPTMNAYIMLSMGCAYTGAFAPVYFMFHLFHKETRVKRTQISDVAKSHAFSIKLVLFVFIKGAKVHFSSVNSIFLVHHWCPHTRTTEAISVSAMKLIEIVQLHTKIILNFCVPRKMFNCLSESKYLAETKTLKCPVAFVVGGFAVNCRKLTKGNYRNTWFACPWHGPDFPAGGHEEWFRFINLLRALDRDPGAPQGSCGSSGARRILANSPGVAQGPVGPFGLTIETCSHRLPRAPVHSMMGLAPGPRGTGARPTMGLAPGPKGIGARPKGLAPDPLWDWRPALHGTQVGLLTPGSPRYPLVPLVLWSYFLKSWKFIDGPLGPPVRSVVPLGTSQLVLLTLGFPRDPMRFL